MTKNWTGKRQSDFGGGAESPEVKDAYLRYKGLGRSKVTFGDSMPPFAREQMTSSKPTSSNSPAAWATRSHVI